MKSVVKRCLTGIFLLTLAAGSANAALISRAGGLAYYDTVLNITWLADANLADTTTFGVSGINANGSMSWHIAQQWITAMNAANYLGENNWRLPKIVDTGAAGCNYGYSGTDCGYNVLTMSGSTVYSEMAHLYYVTLGNVGYFDTSGSPTGCAGAPNYCLTNTGPFSNIQVGSGQYDYYWSGLGYTDITRAWDFGFSTGSQYHYTKTWAHPVWAVRPGDIAAVPVPAAVWLFGSALGVLSWIRRKAMA